MFLSEQQEEDRWKKLTPTQHLPDIGCGTLPTTVFTLTETDEATNRKSNFKTCVTQNIA